MQSPEAPSLVLCISGSLRRHSYNTILLREAARLAPAEMKLTLHEDAVRLPLLDEDLEAEGLPDAVSKLSEALTQAHAVLISTPEYNQSIPGVLKNALDWVSRPKPHPLHGKPVAIMGATIGPWGTRYAQSMLRHTLAAAGALVMPMPQLFVRDSATALAGGVIADAAIAANLTKFLAAFERWIAFCRKA